MPFGTFVRTQTATHTTDYYIRFSSDLDFPRINSFTLYLIIFGIFIVIIYKYYEKSTKDIPNFISNILCLFHVSIKTEFERGKRDPQNV